MQVDDVQILEDKNKFELMRCFKALKLESTEFAKTHPAGKVLLFIVRWIGWDIVNDAFRS